MFIRFAFGEEHLEINNLMEKEFDMLKYEARSRQNAIDDLGPFLEEVRQINECPRKSGNLEPCILFRCKHHVIHRVYSGEELCYRSDDEIVDAIIFLKETCVFDLLEAGRSMKSFSYGRELTSEEIAELFTIHPETIRQTEIKALRKLRNPLRAKRLLAFAENDYNFRRR